MEQLARLAAAHKSLPVPETQAGGCRHQEEVRKEPASMSVVLTYEMPPLVTTAPLAIHRSIVKPEWVDWNGHMNVAYYVTAFDQASGAFMRNIGLGRSYVDSKLGMTFVLEMHITYDRELREGAPMLFRTQLLDCDAKRVHLFRSQVRNKGPWDYKQYNRGFQDFGNYNYGYTGGATGIANDFLLQEAGAAQIAAGTSQSNWGHPGFPWDDRQDTSVRRRSP